MGAAPNWKSIGGHERSLAAPPAAARNSSAHGRSPGSQRIADTAFPDPQKPSGEKASARRSQSRGRPRIGEEAYRVPFSPSVEIEGPCSGLCPSFEQGCQMEVKARSLRREAAKLHSPCSTSMVNVYIGEDPSIERRPARTSAGSSSNGLGGEPRGPNQVLSSHNAVILAPATMEFRVGTSFSASARRPSSPKRVSANRRSISCCSTAGASWVVAHDEAGGAKTQCLALILIRLDARTIPGAQTATEATA